MIDAQLHAESRRSWKALEEGIRFAECLTPEAVEVDSFGHAAALRERRSSTRPPAK
jgi:hypothetical protein